VDGEIALVGWWPVGVNSQQGRGWSVDEYVVCLSVLAYGAIDHKVRNDEVEWNRRKHTLISRVASMPRPLPDMAVGCIVFIVTFCVDLAHVTRVS